MKSNIESRTVFLGDNLKFLTEINSECIDLIYADPPFNKKKQFTAPIGSVAEGASFLDLFAEEDIKDEWVEEFRVENYELHSFLSGVKAMGNSYNYCYLVYMAIRFIECQRILKKTGSFYLHCDHTMSHYLKLLLDCIFGEHNFGNEIVWSYRRWTGKAKRFQRMHDDILFYTKRFSAHKWSWPMEPKAAGTPHYKRWNEYDESLGKMVTKSDKSVEVTESSMRDVWEVTRLQSTAKERTGWPTQKPLALMERIISASSNPGDLVLDPFCGCATTCVAAERLGREWVGIDVAKEAWNQIENRLEKEVPADMFRGEAKFSTVAPTRGKEDARPKKYVYVISNPAYPGMLKVGVAADVNARLNSYQTGDPRRGYKLEFAKQTPEYKTLEPYIHRKFNGLGEWVPGELAEIISTIKTYQPQQSDVIGFASAKAVKKTTRQL